MPLVSHHLQASAWAAVGSTPRATAQCCAVSVPRDRKAGRVLVQRAGLENMTRNCNAQSLNRSWNLKNYERHYLENRKNINLYNILNNRIMYILSFL